MRWFPRSSPIPLQRRWIIDTLRFAQKTPMVGGSGNMHVTAARAARRLRHPPISWDAIWVKAVAIAAARRPVLRTAYLPYPWPRFYVHPHAVATVAVERTWNGAPAVLFDCISDPAALSLEDIDRRLQALSQLPIESIGGFRRQIRIARWPWIARYAMGAIALWWSGRMRSEYIGTYYTMKALRRIHAESVISPISFMFYWNMPSASDDMPVRVFFDHCLCDASGAAWAANAIEDAMNGPIAAELSAIANTSKVSAGGG